MNQNALSLEFGCSTEWNIENSDAIASFVRPATTLQLDIVLPEGLAAPIDFPSLDQMVLPGDSLVLAVESTVPCCEEIAALTAQWFVEQGSQIEHIAVVIADGDAAVQEKVQLAITNLLGKSIPVEVHDPDDSDRLAYLGANFDAEPIYINRTVFDADVVVPIQRARADGSLDDFGSFSMFPLLSDRQTIGHFYRLGSLCKSNGRKKLRAWAEEAAACTGFMTTIQVVPAGGNSVAAFAVGTSRSADQLGRQVMNELWGNQAQVTEAELVLALLDGGANQNWRGIARALWNAEHQSRPGGAIVICTDADLIIGRSLARLQAVEETEESLPQKISNDASDDAIAAALLQMVSESRHVYLISQTPKERLEGIGVGVIDNETELKHLVAQFSSVSVIESAEFRSSATFSDRMPVA